MKTDKLFLLAAMGLGLFACNNNDLVEGSGPNENGAQEEGTTYVAFSIDFNEMGTRATTIGSASGTDEESKVTTVFVLLTEQGKDEIKYTHLIEKPYTYGDPGAEKEKYMFETTAGYYDLYVVVNPDQMDFTGDNKPTKISEYLQKGVTLGVTSITTDNNFMMSSTEKAEVYIQDNVSEKDAQEGTDTETNNFTVSVERVAAKVTMTCVNPELTDNNGGDAGGTLHSASFNLKNRALKSTRMAVSTPLSLDYNTSGNFESPEDFYSITMKETDKSKVASVYCLENIQQTYNKQGNITYVNLSTVFIPSKVVVCDNIDNAGGEDDFKANSGVATFRVVTKGTLSGAYILDTELTAYKNKNENNLPAGVEEVSGPYTNGVCWFGPIWVGENNDRSSYAIERNHWYNLNITGITLPGSNVEPKFDPELPPYPPTNVAITLTVEPWKTVDRDIDLR
jgi:hypothetical protein